MNWTELDRTASYEFTRSATEKSGSEHRDPVELKCMYHATAHAYFPCTANAILPFKQEDSINSMQFKHWLVARRALICQFVNLLIVLGTRTNRRLQFSSVMRRLRTKRQNWTNWTRCSSVQFVRLVQGFYPRDAMLERSLRQRRVRLSVCRSVTRRYCA